MLDMYVTVYNKDLYNVRIEMAEELSRLQPTRYILLYFSIQVLCPYPEL